MISDWRKCSFSKWFRCVVGDDEPKMQTHHFLTQQLYQSCDYFIYLFSYFTKKYTHRYRVSLFVLDETCGEIL